jgi:formate hydrogenlyase subunit 3/multisubunit Na+/H+ antiporter MnhD subunit
MAVVLLLCCVAALLALALAGIALGRRPEACDIVYGSSLGLCLIAFVVALGQLLAGGTSALVLPVGLPWLGAHLRIDPLAAFFALVVNLGGAAASLYGLGYGRHEPAPHRVLPFYPAFLAAMNLVVLADDAFTFLLSWEFMSLTSWTLVMAHHEVEGNARAGYIYLVMASFGTLALLLAFGLLAGSEGGYDFAAIRGERTTLTAALVLVLALLGAGSKAGLVPLHVWLPLAHPAAPSHVSALMSGVMTKVAVYGFVRIVLDLSGEPSWWAAMVVLSLGGATAVMGVLYALMQHDLKRLLAYHTVENIGIIFIGLGLAMAFQANAMGWAAALAHIVIEKKPHCGPSAICSATKASISGR